MFYEETMAERCIDHQDSPETLEDLRVEKNLSQEIVYFNTGIHIGKIETEKYNITVSTLSKLCDYYGVTLEEFFRGIKTE